MSNDLVRYYEAPSSALVFNIGAVHRAATPPDPVLFENRGLQKCVLVKIAPNEAERDLFTDFRSLATKILIPIDVNNLKAGARTVYVGQRGWIKLLQEGVLLDPALQARDVNALELLDQLPGFDPFLAREWLARGGVEADEAYFRLKPAEILAMEDFVVREISGLARMSLGADAPPEEIRALGLRLLGGEADRRLEGLKAVFQLDDAGFLQAMFAWKGFLYFKWVRKEHGEAATAAIAHIMAATPGAKVTGREADLAREEGAKLSHAVELARVEADQLIARFDDAYGRFIRQGEPGPFITFLQEAPLQFMKLGYCMGVLGHVGRTWRAETARLGHGVRMPVSRLAVVLEDLAHTVRFEELALFAG
jgi:hypothetical protein